MKTFNNPVFAYNDSPLMIYQFEVFSHHLTGSPTVHIFKYCTYSLGPRCLTSVFLWDRMFLTRYVVTEVYWTYSYSTVPLFIQIVTVSRACIIDIIHSVPYLHNGPTVLSKVVPHSKRSFSFKLPCLKNVSFSKSSQGFKSFHYSPSYSPIRSCSPSRPC